MVAGVDYAVTMLLGQTGGICGAGAGVLEVLGLAGAPPPVKRQLLEHIVCHGHLAGRVADAGADTAKVAAAHLVDDGAQAVVTGMASAHLDAHVTGGNVELVVNHEQLLGLDLVLAAELGDGSARGVHVRLRLDQHDLALATLFLGIVDVDECDLGAGLVFPVRDTGLTGQLIDRLKAGVVAGLGIFLTRVAKSGNHANLKRLCSCRICPSVTNKFNQRQRLPRPPKARKGCSKVISENSCPARQPEAPRCARREGLSKRTSRSRKAARTFA